MNSPSIISPRIGDDTIELQLTPEQLQGLSQAAEAAQSEAASIVDLPTAVPSPPAIPAPQPALKDPSATRLRLWHLASIAKMAGVIAAYGALAWWGAAELAEKPHALAATPPRPAIVVSRPVLPASPTKPTVRVVNPFDKTEVFEFPAGTSKADGRHQVALILLQRARERRTQWDHSKPEVNLRTASLYRPP